MVDDADALIASWSANADLWTRAVRGGQIASRREVTDAAILGAVRRGPARKILDVGCGEGWLCRALAGAGAEIVGVDVSPELIARALEENGDATFHCLDYAALAVEPARAGGGFDTIVCNFSLLDDLAGPLLAGLARIAAPDARLFIQTGAPARRRSPLFRRLAHRAFCRFRRRRLDSDAVVLPHVRHVGRPFVRKLGRRRDRGAACNRRGAPGLAAARSSSSKPQDVAHRPFELEHIDVLQLADRRGQIGAPHR